MKFTKFGAKLFYLFLLGALIPLCIAGTVVYKYVHDRTREEVLKQLRTTAHDLNEKLHLLLTKRRFRLVDFSSDGFIRDCVEQMAYIPPEYSQIRKKLNTHLIVNKKSLDPNIIEIEIINHRGKVVASTSQDQISKDRSQEDYFRIPFLSQEQKGPYFADTLNTKETSEELQLVFSTILSDKTFHKPLGVLVTKVKGEILQDILDIPNYQSDKENFTGLCEEAYIVNSNKLMIASSSGHNSIHSKEKINLMEIQEVLDSRGNFPVYIRTIRVFKCLEQYCMCPKQTG